MGAERTAQGTRRCRKTRDGGTGARTRDRSPCSNAPPLRFCFNTFCSSLCRAQTAPTEIFKAGSSSFSFLSVSQRCLRFSRHPGAAVRKADTEKLPASECQRVPRILRRGKAARATGTSSERPGRPEPALPPPALPKAALPPRSAFGAILAFPSPLGAGGKCHGYSPAACPLLPPAPYRVHSLP